MVAKLIVWDADREKATRRMTRALEEFEIEGLKTLIPFHKAIMASEQWADGETCRDLIEDRKWLKTLAFPKVEKRRTTTRRRSSSATTSSRSSGKRFEVKVHGEATAAAHGAAPRPPDARAQARGQDVGGGDGDTLTCPLQGNVFKVLVEQGATSKKARSSPSSKP